MKKYSLLLLFPVWTPYGKTSGNSEIASVRACSGEHASRLFGMEGETYKKNEERGTSLAIAEVYESF